MEAARLLLSLAHSPTIREGLSIFLYAETRPPLKSASANLSMRVHDHAERQDLRGGAGGGASAAPPQTTTRTSACLGPTAKARGASSRAPKADAPLDRPRPSALAGLWPHRQGVGERGEPTARHGSQGEETRITHPKHDRSTEGAGEGACRDIELQQVGEAVAVQLSRGEELRIRT